MKIIAVIVVLGGVILTAIILFSAIIKDDNKPTGNVLDTGQKQSTDSAKNLQNKTDQDIQAPGLPENLPQDVKLVNVKAEDGKFGSAKIFTVKNNNQFTIIIEATLLDLPANNNYFSWLAKDRLQKDLLPLGKLQKDAGKFILSASIPLDLSSFSYVIITQETIEDDKPETLILKGIL